MQTIYPVVLIATSQEALQTLINKLSTVQHKENQSTGGFNQGNWSSSHMQQRTFRTSHHFTTWEES